MGDFLEQRLDKRDLFTTLRGRQGALTPETSLINLEGRISDVQVVGLVLDRMSTKSLRVTGLNSSNKVTEGGWREQVQVEVEVRKRSN